MRRRDAIKLHDRDEVEVRIEPGTWLTGHVLGDPVPTTAGVFVPVQTATLGYGHYLHTEVR